MKARNPSITSAGWALFGRAERRLDTDVDAGRPGFEPGATSGRQGCRLGDLGEPEQVGVELPRGLFGADRDRQLDVIDAPPGSFAGLCRIHRTCIIVVYMTVSATTPIELVEAVYAKLPATSN